MPLDVIGVPGAASVAMLLGLEETESIPTVNRKERKNRSRMNSK